MLARLWLIGDVHTEATRLAHVLAHAARAGGDAILCVGDVVDGPEDVVRCVELLREHGVVTVRGNHERWQLADTPYAPLEAPDWVWRWMASLPASRTLDTVAGPLVLGHGVGAHDMTKLGPDDDGYALDSNFPLWELVTDGLARVLVGGHTHQRMVRRFEDLLVVNPGTLARDDEPGFAELDLAAGRVRWYRVDLGGVRADGEVDLARIPRERAPRY